MRFRAGPVLRPVAACLLLILAAAPLHAAKVAVILSKNLSAYQLALKSFKKHFGGDYKLYDMGGSRVEGYRISRKIIAGDYDLVVAFGAKAATVAKSEIKTIPIAYCMVVHPRLQKLTGQSNIAGISFGPPVRVQLETLKQMVPSARKVGIVYSPKASGTFIRKAKAAAKRCGLELIDIEAASRREIPSAIAKLQESAVDTYWMIPDPVLLSKIIVKELLVFTLANRIPFLAPSDAFVKEGALFSVSSDYEEQGRKVSELASRILKGESPAEIGLIEPREVRISVNLKTAETIGIRIPKKVLKNAKVLGGNGSSH